MPTYTARCSKCGKEQDFIRKVDDRNDTPICCKRKTERTLVAPQISAMAFTGHKGFHMTDGTWIEGGTDYKKYMKSHNALSASEGAQEADLQKRNKTEANEKKLNAAVIEAVQKHTN